MFAVAISLLGFALPVSAHERLASTSFTITGLVHRQITFDMQRLSHCQQQLVGNVAIRNHRGEPKYVLSDVNGILLRDLIDSAGIDVKKPKEYSELYIVLTATDGYRNVYSWNELFNSEAGGKVYVVTSAGGRNLADVEGAILVINSADINNGSRHLRALSKIEVRKAK